MIRTTLIFRTLHLIESVYFKKSSMSKSLLLFVPQNTLFEEIFVGGELRIIRRIFKNLKFSPTSSPALLILIRVGSLATCVGV